MIENGGMRAASIGFVPNFDAIEMIMEDDGKTWSGGLTFNESELVEASLVNVPANPDALAKSLPTAEERQAFAAWLHSAEGTAELARAIRRAEHERRRREIAALRAKTFR